MTNGYTADDIQCGECYGTSDHTAHCAPMRQLRGIVKHWRQWQTENPDPFAMSSKAIFAHYGMGESAATAQHDEAHDRWMCDIAGAAVTLVEALDNA